MAKDNKAFDLHLWVRVREGGKLDAEAHQQVINRMVERIKTVLEKYDETTKTPRT